jgi:sec-independent protein translocase protein TatA
LIGTAEILLILIVAILIFGAGKIPEIAKALGKGIKEFKRALKEEDKENKEE